VIGPDGYSPHFDAKNRGKRDWANTDPLLSVDEKLTKILVVLEGLSAEMHELWKRVERLEHPAIVIKADYQRRDRGDFDD